MTAVATPVSRPVGQGLLIRLALRRDRVMVPIWYAVLLLVCFASAASTQTLYATEAERVKAAEAINASPGLVALYGPILDVHSTGELAMTKMTVLYAVFVAVMLLFVVRRHTRLDEEGGQAELIGGAAMTAAAPLLRGHHLRRRRLAGPGAARRRRQRRRRPPVARVARLRCVLGGRRSGRHGAHRRGLPALAERAHVRGHRVAAIGALFVLRAVGDTTDASWLSWLSPFGWNTQLRAYGDTRWWVLLLYVALAGVLVLVAVAARQADLGAGIVAPRPGPATAPRGWRTRSR